MPRKPRLLAEPELYGYALRALAARARSVAEMRRLLERRAERADDTRSVMARLKERGYLNDDRFAERYTAARLENQRLGRARVVRDLRARLVAPEVAERATRDAYGEVDEAALLAEHLERRLRTTGPPKTPQKVASLYRALRRAGFSHGVIFSQLRRFKADTEMLEALGDEEIQ